MEVQTRFNEQTVINAKFTVPSSDVQAGTSGIVTINAQAVAVPHELSKASTDAIDSAAAALLSEQASAFSEGVATQKASDASGSASAALASEGAADDSAITSEISAVNAKASEDDVAANASAASTSEINASNSEAAASTSEGNSASSENAASISESNALDSENAATNSATASSISEGNASGSELAAQNAETGAIAAQTATESLLDQFGDQYLGSKVSDPVTDNDGDPLNSGDVYWNSTDSVLKFYSGTAWVAPEDVASTAASNAQASESAASTSEGNASTSETNAGNSASAASMSEGNAATSETNANNSANAASLSASEALASEDAAGASETAAGISEVNAKASEDDVAANALAAGNSETNASTSESNALSSANTATSEATNSENSALSAASSESNANQSATTSVNAASASSTSANSASSSATAAETAETNAEGWAAEINLPDTVGSGLKVLQRKEDESGFEYVEIPHPISKRQAVLSGPTGSEGKSDFLSLAGSIVSLVGVNQQSPLIFSIGGGYNRTGDRNFVGVVEQSLSWDMSEHIGFLNPSSLLLFLDVDPVTKIMTPVVTSTPMTFREKRPIERRLTRKHTVDDHPNHGSAIASSVYGSNYLAWEAYNENKTTSTSAWIMKNSSALPAWLGYRWQGQRRGVVTNYTISNRTDGFAKSWTLEGSNDGGVSWTVLDTRVDVPNVGAFNSHNFNVENPSGFNYYRVNVSESYSDSTWFLSIQELELFGMFENEFFYHVDHIGLPQVWDVNNGWQEKHRIYVGRVPIATDGALGTPKSAAYCAKEYYNNVYVVKNTEYTFDQEIGTELCNVEIYVSGGDTTSYPSQDYRKWYKSNFHYYDSSSSMGIYPDVTTNTVSLRVSTNYVYYGRYTGGGDITFQNSAYARVYLERVF